MTFEGLFLLSKIQFIYSIWFLGSLVLDMQVFVLIAHSWNFIHVFVPMILAGVQISCHTVVNTRTTALMLKGLRDSLLWSYFE